MMGDLKENYPLPLDKFGTDPAISLWANVDCWSTSATVSGLAVTQITDWVDCALHFATAGQYRSKTSVGTSASEFNPTLDDAYATLIGGILLKPKTTAAGKSFNYMCTRNNNFSNRSQKGTLTIS